MSYKLGDKVSFWSHDQNFEHITIKEIPKFLKEGVQWYKVKHIGTDGFITVNGEGGSRDIPVMVSEYQIHTEESLTKLLNLLHVQQEADKQYADICKKIRQLYSRQHFKFAT